MGGYCGIAARRYRIIAATGSCVCAVWARLQLHSIRRQHMIRAINTHSQTFSCTEQQIFGWNKFTYFDFIYDVSHSCEIFVLPWSEYRCHLVGNWCLFHIQHHTTHCNENHPIRGRCTYLELLLQVLPELGCYKVATARPHIIMCVCASRDCGVVNNNNLHCHMHSSIYIVAKFKFGFPHPRTGIKTQR